MEQYFIPFLLVLLSGLATVVGGMITIYNKQDNENFLPIALGLSAGVMVYVSFVEIFPKAQQHLEMTYGNNGYLFTVLGFFLGVGLIMVIDFFMPDATNPHEHPHHHMDDKTLLRMGLFSMIAITIHNFPEGLATFTVALTDPQLGISIAVAIALHNIPEGVAVSAPIYKATGSKTKAMLYSFYSGLAEPVGAIVGFLILRSIFNDTLFGIIFSMVAGIMVYISIDELLPTAQKHGKHHHVVGGFIVGMIIMAASLIMFR